MTTISSYTPPVFHLKVKDRVCQQLDEQVGLDGAEVFLCGNRSFLTYFGVANGARLLVVKGELIRVFRLTWANRGLGDLVVMAPIADLWWSFRMFRRQVVLDFPGREEFLVSNGRQVESLVRWLESCSGTGQGGERL